MGKVYWFYSKALRLTIFGKFEKILFYFVNLGLLLDTVSNRGPKLSKRNRFFSNYAEMVGDTAYSSVSNKRAGWNKHAGWKKSPNF